jgi:hypothetical protein
MAQAQDPRQPLVDAKERAEKLIGVLQSRRNDLHAGSSVLPPDRLAAGGKALDKTIAAAQRTLQALNRATGANHEQ